jgi:hypothetical protein
MNSFDFTKFRNQLLTENADRFYAPDYIAQKYGADKAKEIEANIEDEGANMWDLYKSLETSQEVDNFIDGFMSEVKITNADKVGSDGVATEDAMRRRLH